MSCVCFVHYIYMRTHSAFQPMCSVCTSISVMLSHWRLPLRQLELIQYYQDRSSTTPSMYYIAVFSIYISY